MSNKGQILQDPFLNALRKDHVPVSIYLVNGIKLQGQIESFDQYVVLLRNTVTQMVYKHAISTVVPARPVNFQVEGSSRNYTARVSATEPNIAASTRTLQVRANVQGDQGGLTPGNFARVTVNFAPDNDAIMIPTQAVIPQARGKKVYLYQDGIAKFIDVETGLRDSSRVQILSGINPGDTVLITGLLSVKPDAKVMLGNVVNGTGNASADSAKAPVRKGNG